MATHHLSRIEWTCTTCGFPIADRQGVVGVPFSQLSRPDSQPTWRPVHAACIDPAADVYGIDVEQIRTASGLVRWTHHLMSKNWFPDSTWAGIISSAVFAERAGA